MAAQIIFEINNSALPRTLFILIFFQFFWSCEAESQSKYIFNHLGIKDGLSSEKAHATAQDSKGYIWIATKNGLQRFDGVRFLSFRHQEGDSTSIPHNSIMRLCIDKHDKLWIITADFKLGYFDINRFRFHPVKIVFKNKMLNRAEGDFYTDENQEIILVLHHYNDDAWGIVTFDQKKNIFSDEDKRFDLPGNWRISFFSIDSLHHHYWYGTNQGLVKYNPETGNFNYRGHNPDKDAIINALQNFSETGHPLLDRRGNFWMTTFQDNKNVHLIFYDFKNKKVIDRSDELQKAIGTYYEIHNILPGSDGDVWLNGLGMLVHVNDKNNFEVVPLNSFEEYNINFEDSYTFRHDRENNTWITTDNGLYWFNPQANLFRSTPIRRFNSRKNFKADVTDIKELHNGNILVSTWGAGLVEYDKNFEPVNSPIVRQGLEKGEGMVWSILQRGNGDVWRGHQDGWLFIYHAKSNSTEKIQLPVFRKKTIRQIAEDRNGNLWFGTQGGDVIKWMAQSDSFYLAKKMNKMVKRLYADNKGDIWIVTEKVIKLNADDDSMMHEYVPLKADGRHLPSPDLNDIKQYDDSTFIIAGEQVSILNTNTGMFRYLSSNTGMPSDYISNVVISKDGNPWMSTENGIYVRNFKTTVSSTFGPEDGLINSKFANAASCLLRNGTIIFGTSRDILSFDPLKLYSPEFAPPHVEITAVKLFNKNLLVDSILHLKRMEVKYFENSFVFQFSTLSFMWKYNTAYMMEGIDKKWVKSSSSNEAVYSYLPPGNYVFKVGAPDSKGNISNIVSMPIHIEAPIWKTWEFYTTLLLLGGFIIWRLYKERKNHWKNILYMRSTIGKDLHNEVRTTLKNISALSEIAAIKADSNQEQAKDYIREIKQKSRRSVIAMDDVMWSIDPANDSMNKIIDRIYEIADTLNSEYETRIDIDIDKNVQHLRFSMKERLEFMMIYKRAVLLLSRDSHSKHIKVDLDKEKGGLSLKLFAEGTLLSEFDQKVLKSVEEIKTRASDINAVAEIQSDASGTAILTVIHHKKQA
jgi:ligand-binding sensor domain-containing protein